MIGRSLVFLALAVLVVACSKATAPSARYLERTDGGELYARLDGGDIANAPASDNDVLHGYVAWVDKGRPGGPHGERLTIMTAKATYAANEEIRVVHVHDAPNPGVELYVMGPKAIYGEYVDGALASPAAAAPPLPYDGAVLQSPNVDYNYEVSVHRLPPGKHTIEWRFATLSGPTVLRSNVLTLDVR